MVNLVKKSATIPEI